jgi:hypothetical protein
MIEVATDGFPRLMCGAKNNILKADVRGHLVKQAPVKTIVAFKVFIMKKAVFRIEIYNEQISSGL